MERHARTLVSIVIVMILSLQAAAVLLRVDKSWPFQHYPMYSEYHGEGDRIEVALTVHAVLDDGSEMVVTPDDAGIPFFVFRRQFVQAVLDENRPKVEFFLRHVKKRTGRSVTSLRVEDYPAIVTRTGMQPAPPPKVIKTLSLAK